MGTPELVGTSVGIAVVAAIAESGATVLTGVCVITDDSEVVCTSGAAVLKGPRVPFEVGEVAGSGAFVLVGEEVVDSDDAGSGAAVLTSTVDGSSWSSSHGFGQLPWWISCSIVAQMLSRSRAVHLGLKFELTERHVLLQLRLCHPVGVEAQGHPQQ